MTENYLESFRGGDPFHNASDGCCGKLDRISRKWRKGGCCVVFTWSGPVVEWASWPAVRACFPAINFVRTSRCARERGPGGPHYLQNLHTYRTALRTGPRYLRTGRPYLRTASVKIISIGRRFVHRAISLAQRLVQAVGLRGFLVGCVWLQ
jgi:hypothetical protein